MTRRHKANGRVRIVVVGAGLIGQAHILRIRDEPGAQLAGIVDTAPRAKQQAEALGVAWSPDLAGMFKLGKPDGVVIALPNQLHFSAGMAAIAAGVPLFLEKPICLTVKESVALSQAAAKARVPVQVGHHRRHSPLTRQAKEIIASGRLGKIVAVNALCWFLKPKEYFQGAYAWRRKPGGGVMLINLIHVVDDLRNLCGDITSVQAVASTAARRFPVEDTAAVILRFRNGALGTLSISDSAAAPWSWELTAGENRVYPRTDESCYLFAGKEGSLSFPRLDVWRHGPGQGWWSPIHVERSIRPEQGPTALRPSGDPLTLQMSHFCQVLRGEAKPIPDAWEGTKTLRTTLAIQQAAATGRTITLA
jgi:predicted dehydrogenase